MIIEVTNRKGQLFKVIVDDDFEYADNPICIDAKGYAVIRIDKKPYRLHRVIMNAPQGVQVDHINRNKLDCRKENLRYATNQQNQANIPHKGVRKIKDTGNRKKLWRARIRKDGKVWDKCFLTEKEALQAYREKHAELYGEFSAFS